MRASRLSRGKEDQGFGLGTRCHPTSKRFSGFWPAQIFCRSAFSGCLLAHHPSTSFLSTTSPSDVAVSFGELRQDATSRVELGEPCCIRNILGKAEASWLSSTPSFVLAYDLTTIEASSKTPPRPTSPTEVPSLPPQRSGLLLCTHLCPERLTEALTVLAGLPYCSRLTGMRNLG